MSRYKVLLLDDEPEVLKALTRVLRREYELVCFTDGNKALLELENHLYSVLVTDMRMPEINGATFLKKAHEISPMSQKILLTGYADPKDTSDAINTGHVDFYLNKPWDNAELIDKIKMCVENFVDEYQQGLINKQIVSQNEQLMESQSELMQQLKDNEKALSKIETVKACFSTKLKQYYKTTADILSHCIQMHNQDAFSHGERIASQVGYLCQQYHFSPFYTFQTVIAARLYELGKMQYSQMELEHYDTALKADMTRKKAGFVQMSASLLRHFQDFSGVATIIRHIFEYTDGTGTPAGLKGEKVPLPCQMIQICAVFDKLVTGKTTGTPIIPATALSMIRDEKAGLINMKMINTLVDMITDMPSSADKPIQYAIAPKQLKQGMTLAHDLPLEAAKSNYLNKGHVLSDENVKSLQNIAENRKAPLILFIYPETQISEQVNLETAAEGSVSSE